jgi:hypothetical protein
MFVGHMRGVNWSAPTTPAIVARRAGGRRKYNALRKLRAELRRRGLVAALHATGQSLMARGTAGWWARRAGIADTTARRDLAALLAQLRAGRPCPICGTVLVSL